MKLVCLWTMGQTGLPTNVDLTEPFSVIRAKTVSA